MSSKNKANKANKSDARSVARIIRFSPTDVPASKAGTIPRPNSRRGIVLYSGGTTPGIRFSEVVKKVNDLGGHQYDDRELWAQYCAPTWTKGTGICLALVEHKGEILLFALKSANGDQEEDKARMARLISDTLGANVEFAPLTRGGPGQAPRFAPAAESPEGDS